MAKLAEAFVGVKQLRSTNRKVAKSRFLLVVVVVLVLVLVLVLERKFALA